MGLCFRPLLRCLGALRTNGRKNRWPRKGLPAPEPRCGGTAVSLVRRQGRDDTDLSDEGIDRAAPHHHQALWVDALGEQNSGGIDEGLARCHDVGARRGVRRRSGRAGDRRPQVRILRTVWCVATGI
jgi:hypothetical protein